MHTADSLGRTPETGSIAKKLSSSKNNKRDKVGENLDLPTYSRLNL